MLMAKSVWLSLSRVFTSTLTHFHAKTIFSRGYWAVHNTCGNYRGMRGYFNLCSKNGISGEEWGLMGNSLHGGGMDIFWNYTLMKSVFLTNLKLSIDDLVACKKNSHQSPFHI